MEINFRKVRRGYVLVHMIEDPCKSEGYRWDEYAFETMREAVVKAQELFDEQYSFSVIDYLRTEKWDDLKVSTDEILHTIPPETSSAFGSFPHVRELAPGEVKFETFKEKI